MLKTSFKFEKTKISKIVIILGIFIDLHSYSFAQFGADELERMQKLMTEAADQVGSTGNTSEIDVSKLAEQQEEYKQILKAYTNPDSKHPTIPNNQISPIEIFLLSEKDNPLNMVFYNEKETGYKIISIDLSNKNHVGNFVNTQIKQAWTENTFSPGQLIHFGVGLGVMANVHINESTEINFNLSDVNGGLSLYFSGGPKNGEIYYMLGLMSLQLSIAVFDKNKNFIKNTSVVIFRYGEKNWWYSNSTLGAFGEYKFVYTQVKGYEDGPDGPLLTDSSFNPQKGMIVSTLKPWDLIKETGISMETIKYWRIALFGNIEGPGYEYNNITYNGGYYKFNINGWPAVAVEGDIENKIITNAKAWIGTKYVDGGESKTNGVDCSGLIHQVLNESGIPVVDMTANGYGSSNYFVKINPTTAKSGDLVWFPKQPSGHIGIVNGSGTFIGSQSSTGVRQANFNNGYWGGRKQIFLRLKDFK